MHTQILRRCGLVLIAVGTVDIAFMIWCIVHRVSWAVPVRAYWSEGQLGPKREPREHLCHRLQRCRAQRSSGELGGVTQ